MAGLTVDLNWNAGMELSLKWHVPPTMLNPRHASSALHSSAHCCGVAVGMGVKVDEGEGDMRAT